MIDELEENTRFLLFLFLPLLAASIAFEVQSFRVQSGTVRKSKAAGEEKGGAS